MSMRTILGAGVVAAALFAANPAWAQPGPPPPDAAAEDELAGDAAQPEEASPAPRRSGRRGRGPARPRLEIAPYVEVNAGVSAELAGDSDDTTVTYGSVAAGVDARIQTRRVSAQASYRYERILDIDGETAEDDVHSGVAMVHAEAAPGVSFDAGALAARTGSSGRGSVLTPRDSSAQLFSAYAGPTVSTQVGPLSVGAAYRLGYVRVEDDAGDLAGEDFGESTVHNATASVGMGAGALPFGWTVGGGYVREESGEFDSRFEAAYVRGDVVFPVGPTLALTAGVGYEHLDSSQQDLLRDANGVPILIGGRPVADPTRPRLRGFDSSGLIYDAGLIWRPSPRTELQARAGYRYGGTTVTGSVRHQTRRGVGVSANVYDVVGAGGTQIVNNLNALPTEFRVNRNPLTGAFDGCVFGTDPGTGICFDQALNSLSSRGFRARGANLMVSGGRGPWSYGAGAGYEHRRYRQLVSGDLTSLDPVTDDSLVLNAGVSRRLGRFSSMSIDAVASWYDSDRPLSDSAYSTGLTAGYYRSFFIPGLQFHTALGLFHTDTGLIDSTTLSFLIGLRYTF